MHFSPWSRDLLGFDLAATIRFGSQSLWLLETLVLACQPKVCSGYTTRCGISQWSLWFHEISIAWFSTWLYNYFIPCSPMIFPGQNHVFIACVFPVWFTLSGSLTDRSAGNSGYDSLEPAVRVDWSAAKDEHWGWFQPSLIWICNWMLNLWRFSSTLIWKFPTNVKCKDWWLEYVGVLSDYILPSERISPRSFEGLQDYFPIGCAMFCVILL